jgi:hypothetical protein
VPISRLLIPAVGPPPVGQPWYALPALAKGTQAAPLYPNNPAESQETTV